MLDDFTVSLQYTITREQVANMLCAAFEGGSNYWCKASLRMEPAWEYTSDATAHYLHEYPLNPGGAVLLHDLEGESFWLDYGLLQKGVVVFAQKHPACLRDLIEGNDDAETGDVFLQCCLFGEVVYG